MKPQPFCFNKSKVKAFILGADPTNFSDSGNRIELNYAFGIGQNPNYFRAILNNLNLLGIHLEDVFIQNLIPGYQEKVTGKNKSFFEKAKGSANAVATEFNKIDRTKRIPVFLTAEDVYKAVMKDKEELFSAESIYRLNAKIPIVASSNLLERPLIPLFRHSKYALSEWPDYTNHVRDLLLFNDLTF